MLNTDELYFKRLEELSMKKINNMRRIGNNANMHGDSLNLIYRGHKNLLSIDFT